ncbi:unnamed protein product [Lymnaea stagnalis]|uniref:Hexosyltransferase n=1 Tax=Lymnaea stagnalis TaxID=6523 RepID=A0AAV2HG98_LYMST
MYVNVPLLVQTLRGQAASPESPRAFVMGSVQWGAQPMRSTGSKWYTPYDVFKEDTYPNYVSGTAYAMTSLASRLLFEASLRLPTFWLEDIYVTGLCSRKAGVSVLNNDLFTYNTPLASGCTFRNQISGHRYSLEDIAFIHKALYDPDTVCERASD